jgi:hypothetical protein
MFGVVSRNFVAARHPFRKRVLGCIQSTCFCHRNHFFVFRNEHAQSTTLGPKLLFGVVLHNFVAARHQFRKRESGAYKHEFLPPEPFLRFSQRTCPIHYFRSKTHVWGGFAQFRCRTSPIPKTGVGVHTNTSFRHQNHFFVFRNEHAQSITLGPKLIFGVVSRNFVAARHPFRKRVSGCIQSTSFGHRNHFFVSCNEHAESTTLGPKLMFGVVLRNFVAVRHPFLKLLSGCTRSTSFGHRNHFFVSCNEHAQSTTLGPKLMFVVVSRNFVAARHPFRKRVSGCIQSTRFCHRNRFFVFRNEHAQSITLGPKLMFGVVSRNFVAARHPFRKRVSGAYKA